MSQQYCASVDLHEFTYWLANFGGNRGKFRGGSKDDEFLNSFKKWADGLFASGSVFIRKAAG